METSNLIVTDRRIMGGTPVIRGTHVPISTLFDYLMDGLGLEEFLDHFPTVKRRDAIAILTHSRQEALETAGMT